MWLSLLGSGFATQMASVAVGWQVYAIHRSAFDLGLIGLAEFAPLLLLALPAGQLADRLPRPVIAASSNLAEAVVVALLLVVTIGGADELWAFVALAALTGVAAAFGGNPQLVPAAVSVSAAPRPAPLPPPAGCTGAMLNCPDMKIAPFTPTPFGVHNSGRPM